MHKHISILLDSTVKIDPLVDAILQGDLPNKAFNPLIGLTGKVFSKSVINRFVDEEEYHDIKTLTSHTPQSLKSMSSGEQKKCLLHYLFQQQPDYIVFVRPFDNLDVEAQADLKKELIKQSEKFTFVFFVHRYCDILEITDYFFTYNADTETLQEHNQKEALLSFTNNNPSSLIGNIPLTKQTVNAPISELVVFDNVSVYYQEKPILSNISWTIKKGEFWQLIGPNGSGKSTIISMITGDNPKAYRQQISLFGNKKGSGENVWDIKKRIGYFTPGMTLKFKGYHTLQHMIISGFHDSIGLYVQPSDFEVKVANEWIHLLGLASKQHFYFHELSEGEKRLVMTARAMIKHPELLILDEPTVGLDDYNAGVFAHLVQKIAEQCDLAIIYVSHRQEPGLKPHFIYELQSSIKGSVGFIYSPPN